MGSRILFFFIVALGATLLAGCSVLPKPREDPTRFYVLSASGTAPAAPAANAPSVLLRPIELASYLKSRPLLVRRGENEIEFRDYARWGERLELGLARVLREELLARGAAGVRLGGPRDVADPDTLVLSVRVLACEGAADGAVLFRAGWELTRAGAKSESVARGDFQPKELRWDGKNEATLVASLSEAVTALATEIAGRW